MKSRIAGYILGPFLFAGTIWLAHQLDKLTKSPEWLFGPGLTIIKVAGALIALILFAWLGAHAVVRVLRSRRFVVFTAVFITVYKLARTEGADESGVVRRTGRAKAVVFSLRTAFKMAREAKSMQKDWYKEFDRDRLRGIAN